MFDVDRILECRIISVSEEARGRGLAKELMKRSIEIARENSFKLFKVDATGAFSQRICTSLGLREVRRVAYADYLDDNGEQVFNVPPPHDALSVMVLELEPCARELPPCLPPKLRQEKKKETTESDSVNSDFEEPGP